jgi:hypothetical protein
VALSIIREPVAALYGDLVGRIAGEKRKAP